MDSGNGPGLETAAGPEVEGDQQVRRRLQISHAAAAKGLMRYRNKGKRDQMPELQRHHMQQQQQQQ
jgi:hypothetical protein